jgi:hypothetical protein
MIGEPIQEPNTFTYYLVGNLFHQEDRKEKFIKNRRAIKLMISDFKKNL